MDTIPLRFNFYKHLQTKTTDIEDLKNTWCSLLTASEKLATQNIVNFVFLLTGFDTKYSIHEASTCTNYVQVINRKVQNVTWEKEMYLFNRECWFIRRVEEFFHRIIEDSEPDLLDMSWFSNLERFTFCLLSASPQKHLVFVGTFLRLQILISLSYVRVKLAADSENLKSHCFAFKEGIERGFDYASLPLARKFCELIVTFPWYYVTETPYVRNFRILLELSDFNTTIISVRSLRVLVISDCEEISRVVRMFIIENARNFFKLLSNKDPLWITECMNLFLSVHKKHDFSPGLHTFHSIENNQIKLFNLIVSGTKSVRSVVCEYLLLFISPRIYLHCLINLPSPSLTNALDQIVDDTWQLEIYCNWRYYVQMYELNPDKNSLVIWVLFLQSTIKKLMYEIEHKFPNKIQIEYLQTFFDVIDSLYHSLKDEKRCQINLMRTLETIDVHQLQNADEQTREIITNCLDYFFRIIVADYQEYVKRQPYQKQQYEEADIIFKICLKWSQVCSDLEFSAKIKALLSECRIQFLHNLNQFDNPNHDLSSCSDNFEFALMNFAVFLKHTRMTLISLTGLEHLWSVYLPNWIRKDFNLHLSCKISLFSICGNIIWHVYQMENVKNDVVQRSLVMEYLEILGPKMIDLCEDVLKKEKTISLFGKGEIFATVISIIRVYANETFRIDAMCHFNVTTVYLDILGEILEYITIECKDARCLTLWIALFEEVHLPDNIASAHVLQHFGKPTPFDALLLKLFKLVYFRQSNGSSENTLMKLMSKIVFMNGKNEEAVAKICIRFVQVIKYDIKLSTEKRTKLFVGIIRSSLEHVIVSRKVKTCNQVKIILVGTDLMLREILKSKSSCRQLLIYLQSVSNDLNVTEKETTLRIERSLLLKID